MYNCAELLVSLLLAASGVVGDDAIVYTGNLPVQTLIFVAGFWTVPLRDSEQVKGIFRPVFKH